MAEQETQLITIKAPETKDDQIDLGKLRDIRRTLRRRYSNRGNFAKIFRDWDKARDGLISLTDLQSMLNNMGISVNINEAKALIASANSTIPDKLDMDDFLYLIFSENDEIDNETLNSKTIKSPAELEELNRKMRMISYKSSGKENIQNLKSFLRTRIPLLLKSFSLYSENNNLCSIQQFSDSIKGLKIGSRFTTNEILNQIFDEYKNSQNLLEIDKFVNDISEARNKNNFFSFQEKYLKMIEEKADKTKNDLENLLKENSNLIKAEEEVIKRKREVLEEQIHNRINRPKLNSFDDRYIRNSQPSKEFLLQVMSKRDDYTKKHRDLVKMLEPKEVLEGNINFT